MGGSTTTNYLVFFFLPGNLWSVSKGDCLTISSMINLYLTTILKVIVLQGLSYIIILKVIVLQGLTTILDNCFRVFFRSSQIFTAAKL